MKNFVSERYTRYILVLNVTGESAETFAVAEDLRQTVSAYYPELHLAGMITTVSEVREMVDVDYPIVNFISIGAVLLILLITFRSAMLPVILTVVIELAIFINMGIPYFTGTSLMFIGYMIVSSVQLGATIDYATLLTDKYMNARRKQGVMEAMLSAIEQSYGSILTSFLILGTAGICLYTISQTPSVSEMGLLIGRGAFLSGLLVFVLLPQLLVLFDRFFKKKKGEDRAV